jgi:sugar lactone lactonase YvrE
MWQTARPLVSSLNCVAPVGAVLGESPLWDPRINRLLWLDIKGGKIFRLDPETGRTETIAAAGMVSAIGLAAGGGYVCVRRSGFARLKIDKGEAKFSALADPEADLPGNRFNDGKVDPKGGFWAGTMDDAEKAVSGAWWRLAPDGSATKLDDGYRVTNGPAFDAARGRVYLTDSARQTIFVADSDGETLGEKRVFLQFGEGDFYPDGMEVDAEGCLWAAFWDGGEVRRFSPDGARLERLALPVPRPTSLAIVGERMFITSASVGLSPERLKSAPLSGGLFAARLTRPLGTAKPFEFRG